MSLPPAQLQRTETTPATRSDIWYRDGSVVLQAASTQFRVHWGVLSHHSSFFRHLEDLPQPPNQPTVEGCPVVELHDTAEDVEYLLKALYDLTFLTQPALPLAAVAAFIRLGRKYDFKIVLDSAVDRITFENPKTLDEYDALLVDGTHKPTRLLPYRSLYFDMLTLARENNIVSALPVAYFRALRCGLAQLLDGIRRRDESLASLSSADLRLCLFGRERLVSKQFQPGYTLGWLRTWPYTDCGDPSRCRALRTSMFHSYMDGNIVASFAKFVDDDVRKSFCGTCSQHVLEAAAAGRKKMWEELPQIFDLPLWGELQNDL
ncbi:hypothetical protein K438DRAFT_1977875 [Mycena galopus ATCC 62051]|nr:hypothetical protein K438DRAFT_1977875 [Mycena galopus ATCC 62051]